MNSNRRHNILIFLMLMVALLVNSCSQEEIFSEGNGTLHINLGYITDVVDTRATPEQLGKPLAECFNLRVQRNGKVHYDGPFKENLELTVGTYDITAYYGEDVVIGKDAPYYEGVASVQIEKDASTSVVIPCRVANSLISVNFGRDEVEHARFEKNYEKYGLIVRVGSFSLAITEEELGSSIYFPAGSQPALFFYGLLRENGETVSCEVSSEALPEVYGAADHAIITLCLPDPVSAAAVSISKVEMETVTIGQTIPLSWLPAPVVIAQHCYDDMGYLQGTDIEFSNSYPGMSWKAVVTNANGQVVRSIEVGDMLLSSYRNSPEYPYLPSGDYKATYYIANDTSFKEVNSVIFSVGKPELRLTIGGYTSYTKYLEGDIEGANACDGNSVYDISVDLNVAEAVLAKNEYTFTFRYASGYTENVVAGKNRFYRDIVSGQAPSFDPYRLEANVTFDGVSLNGVKDFYITGLPVTYAPPSEGNGWSKSSGTVSFNSGDVKLDNGSISNAGLAIPSQTTVAMDYNVMIRAGATLLSTTKFTITIGSTEVFSQTQRGNAFSESSSNYSGSKAYTSSDQTTTIKCSSNKSYSSIYSLSLKYGK